MSKTIDYYHFLISPWSYLAIGRFNELVDRHGVSVNYIPISPVPVFEATGGVLPGNRHKSRQRFRMDELKRWSSHLEVPMNLTPAFFPADGSIASRMLLIAGDQGKGAGALSDALLTAVWASEQNIADEATLVSIANDCDLDGSGLLEAAKDDAMGKRLEQVTQQAIDNDVFGSPTWVVDGENFWGQDRLEFLDRHLAE